MVYCGRLSLVGDLLQALFKEAYSLQKGLMELLDKTSLENSASEEEVSDIIAGRCTCVDGQAGIRRVKQRAVCLSLYACVSVCRCLRVDFQRKENTWLLK